MKIQPKLGVDTPTWGWGTVDPAPTRSLDNCTGFLPPGETPGVEGSSWSLAAWRQRSLTPSGDPRAGTIAVRAQRCTMPDGAIPSGMCAPRPSPHWSRSLLSLRRPVTGRMALSPVGDREGASFLLLSCHTGHAMPTPAGGGRGPRSLPVLLGPHHWRERGTHDQPG